MTQMRAMKPTITNSALRASASTVSASPVPRSHVPRPAGPRAAPPSRPASWPFPPFPGSRLFPLFAAGGPEPPWPASGLVLPLPVTGPELPAPGSDPGLLLIVTPCPAGRRAAESELHLSIQAMPACLREHLRRSCDHRMAPLHPVIVTVRVAKL